MEPGVAKLPYLKLEETRTELSNFKSPKKGSISFEINLNEADHQKFVTPLVKAIETLHSLEAKYNDYYDKKVAEIEMNRKAAENSFSELVGKLKGLIEKINSTKKISLEGSKRPLDCILVSINKTSLDFLHEFEILSLDFLNNFSDIKNNIWNNEYFKDISNKIEKLCMPNEFPYEGYVCHKFSNGDWYIGQWENNNFNGKGAYYIFETDTYYEATFENNYLIEGKNRDSSGNTYSGSFRNNWKNGKGTQLYANGNIYEGSWVDNYPNGEGMLLYSLGDFSSGTFYNGKLNGRGLEVYSNGDTYEGDFADGLKHGYGIYKYSNGNYYEGDWKLDEKNGKGKLVCQGKGYYEGKFKNDKKHGRGKEISFTSEEVYIGSFKNDSKSGYGKLSDGFTIIQGKWCMDALISEDKY